MTTLTNWQKFDKAFNQVSAFIVLDKDTKELVAKISLKCPKDGAGRLTCYMHIIGSEVQIGTASGYGYDKRTTAIISASEKCYELIIQDEKWHTLDKGVKSFLNLLRGDVAQSGWQEVINEKNGFIVIQVI